MIIFDFKGYEGSSGCAIGFDGSSLSRAEREQYTYVRGLAYSMVEWLDHHYTIRLTSGSMQQQSYDSILNAVGQFLADVTCYQCLAKASHIDGAPGCNPHHLEEHIRQVFHVNGTPNPVYRGYHARAKEIALTGDKNHHITYGPIFTDVWHAERKRDVVQYSLKGNSSQAFSQSTQISPSVSDLDQITSMGRSDAKFDLLGQLSEWEGWNAYNMIGEIS